MRKAKKQIYRDVEVLRQIIQDLEGREFHLDCEHKITFGYWLGNDITILNRKEPKSICSQCGH